MAEKRIKITKQTTNQFGVKEFWFDNESWCSIDEENESYEFQDNPRDGETYFEGSLEFDEQMLVGYDGCYELPQEVIMAVKELGYSIDEFI